MSLVVIDGPGLDGYVSDRPNTQLRQREAELLQDARDLESAVEERRGWEYAGDAAVSSGDPIHGLWRATYVKAGATLTTAVIENFSSQTEIFEAPASGGGTSLLAPAYWNTTAKFLPRTQYRDMTIFCGQDGVEPIQMFGGRKFDLDGVALGQYTTDQSIITATSGTWADTEIDRGAFILCQPSSAEIQPIAWGPVGERVSTTVMSIEGMKSTGSGAHGAFDAYSMALAWPCVKVYDVGTISRSGTTITGVGTAWQNGDVPIDAGHVTLGGDALLALETSGNPTLYGVSSVAGDTSLAVGGASLTITNSRYEILRRCPFTEAEAHKGSLWGTGVKQHPSRVYVSPPGWNPAYAPYLATLADEDAFYDPESTVSRVTPSELKLGYVDVPASESGDPVQALLSTSGPLLAITNEHAYQINGVYGALGVSPILLGAGCIDKRSAITTAYGNFWAGENGIFHYNNGGTRDLTKGRISREWRGYMANWTAASTDYVVSIVAAGYLLVSYKVGANSGTFRFNLATGSVSTVSNFVARSGWSGNLEGESETGLFSDVVSNSGGHDDRVCDVAPAFNGNGDATDDAGTGPRFKFHSPANLPQLINIQRPTRLTRTSINVQNRDTAGTGSTASWAVYTRGQLNGNSTATTTLTTLDSQNDTDHAIRVRRNVGRRGLWHQVRVEKTATQTTQSRFRLERIACDVRPQGREV